MYSWITRSMIGAGLDILEGGLLTMLVRQLVLTLGFMLMVWSSRHDVVVFKCQLNSTRLLRYVFKSAS